MGNKIIYNKLVRDRIPEIIKSRGDIPETKILDEEDYIKRLDEKLFEECTELLEAKTKKEILGEMADVQEVLRAKADFMGISMDEVEEVRVKKAEERGAFKNKILLKSTTSREG